MELLPKKTEGNDPSSPFFSWSKIGDSITGLYIDYEKSAGQWGKPQVTLKTANGKKMVSCSPIDLRLRLEGPALAGDLDGQWLTITFVREEDTGKENKKKIFKVDASAQRPTGAASKPVTTQAEPQSDADEEPPPF